MGFFVKNRRLETGGSSVVVPTGDSANRPLSPTFGSFRYNTGIGTLEFFNDTTFDSLALSGVVGITIDSFVGDGSTSSDTPGYAKVLNESDWKPGVILGKALSSCDSGEHIIEIVVGPH